MLGLSHLQFEALLAAARESDNPFDLALVAMLGLLGLRVSEASRAGVEDIGEEHGHRVVLVHGKGGKEALVPLPPAVGRALDRAVADRVSGPVLLNRRRHRMDRHCATRCWNALLQLRDGFLVDEFGRDRDRLSAAVRQRARSARLQRERALPPSSSIR